MEEASQKVYDTLIKSVNDNIAVFYEYFDVKKKSQGLREIALYDQYVKEKQIEKKYGNINDLNKALEKIFDYPSMFCEINYSDIYEIKIKEE